MFLLRQALFAPVYKSNKFVTGAKNARLRMYGWLACRQVKQDYSKDIERK